MTVRRTLLVIPCLLMLLALSPHGEAADLVRNGGFASGLSEWIISPAIDPTWNPLSGGGVNLHPPASGYRGTVIYQNLNVTGIANKTINVSVNLTKNYAPDGRTFALYLSYVSNSNQVQRVRVLNPANSGMDFNTPTAVSGSYAFPADARKLVKLEIVKEDDGDFTVDDIVAAADGVTTGPLPYVASLSATSGAYQSSFTITGTNFGPPQGSVSVGGSSMGVSVTNWADTSITVTVREPARSGRVIVAADYTESNADQLFDVTSPNFAVDVVNPQLSVIKGQTAEFIVKVDLRNGFTTTNGIGFMVDNPDLMAHATFMTVPVKNSGGVVLRIDTTSLAAGVYQGNVQSLEDTSYARFAPFTLNVGTVSDIKFVDSSQSPSTYITAKTVTVQGQFGEQSGVTYEVRGSGGNVISNGLAGITLQSGNESIIRAYKRYWGYDIYALANGQTTLIATAPDGTSRSLNVTVAIPPGTPMITSIVMLPESVSNMRTDTITFQAMSTDRITWIGGDMSGLANFATTFSDPNGIVYPDDKTVISTFAFLNTPVDIGTAVFYVMTGSGPTASKAAVPLTTYNDPSTAAVRVVVQTLDGSMAPEMFTLKFYGADLQNPTATRSVFSMPGIVTQGTLVGGIQPGTYKVLFEQGMGGQSQWYPIADDASKALPVTLSAGQTQDMYFLFGPQPQPSTYSISGAVTSGGSPVANVAMALTGAGTGSTTTDGSGNYTFSGLLAGTYTVTPSKGGYAFTPANKGVTIASANVTGQDFTAVAAIALHSGWNFISLPLQPADTNIGSVLSDISSKVNIVWGYDNGTQAWRSYKPGRESNALTSMESGQGYWIFMSEDGLLMPTGSASSSSIPLYDGWNLVGYKGQDGVTPATALTGIADRWAIIWGWENNQWSAKHPTINQLPVPALNGLYRGKAYWIKITAGLSTNWTQ